MRELSIAAAVFIFQGLISCGFGIYPAQIEYQTYNDVKEALLAGHSLVVSVNSSLCGRSSIEFNVNVGFGFSAQNWWIQDVGDFETLHLVNLHLNPNDPLTDSTWIQREVILHQFTGDGGDGEFKEMEFQGGVLKAVSQEHGGTCNLGSGIIINNLRANNDEMVKLEDYESMKSELLSGRQIIGYLDFDKPNCLGPIDPLARPPHPIHSLNIEAFFIDNSDKKEEKMVLVSTYPIISDAATGIQWNRIHLEMNRTDGDNFLTVQAVLKDPSAFETSRGSLENGLTCDLPTSMLHLFSRRMEYDIIHQSKEDVKNALDYGWSFHNTYYEDFCHVDDEETVTFLGTKVVGQRLETAEMKFDPSTTSTVKFLHSNGDANPDKIRFTTTEVDMNAVDQITGKFNTAPFNNSHHLDADAGSLFKCNLVTSSVLRSQDMNERTALEMSQIIDYFNQNQAIPILSAVAYNHVTGRPMDDKYRAMFSAATVIKSGTDAGVRIKAISTPQLVHYVGKQTWWRTFILELNRNSAGADDVTFKILINISDNPAVQGTEVLWKSCALDTTKDNAAGPTFPENCFVSVFKE